MLLPKESERSPTFAILLLVHSQSQLPFVDIDILSNSRTQTAKHDVCECAADDFTIQPNNALSIPQINTFKHQLGVLGLSVNH